ncbi:Putative structural protein [Cellulophaga phage phi14:2]|uniref:Uncharacterized protein n=1 Tax=Cellulophaga phage phi14:2 TaxID=1327990 RepID=S0A0T9_9CAUD|nr:Putative structural protein [Cellulophaga phage phi14:2]AGO48981.1 hypothetical protein Phi14:2_gp103 [Cellulophaga phage phi14:2]
MDDEINDLDLDMGIFGEIPSIDLEEGEPLFPEDGEGEPIEEEITPNTGDEPINEEVIPDEVVGEDNKGEVEDDKPADSTADESSPNLFSSLTALLVEEGLISSTDAKPDSAEAFADLFKGEIKKNEFSDLNEVQRTYLENLRTGIPEDEIKTHLKVQTQFESIKEEDIKANPELRQKIIYNDFINKGFTEEKAIKMLRRSIELEADTEDATEALSALKEFDKQNFEKRKLQIQADKEAEINAEIKRVDTLKNKIKTSKEIISGFPLTDNVREQVEKNLFTVVGTNPEGKSENALMKYARENTENYQLITNYLYTITKGFKDFGLIEKTKNTKIVNDLERAIKSSTRISDSGKPAYMQDPDSYSIDIEGHDLIID